jgi:tripartite ATP-independent transporter DctP family solute receptor
MKKLVGLILTGTICLSLLAGCSATKQTDQGTAAGGVKTMKLAAGFPKGNYLAKGFNKFAEVVEKESNGKIKVEVYTDGVLGDDRRCLEGIQMGTIQGMTVSTGPISSFAPAIAVFDLPFLFKDRETAYKILDGKIGRDQLANLEKSGFIGLEYWENGYRHLSNNKREVTTMEELKGLKIRTQESPIHVDIWKAMGANPTPMSMGQVYTALEQKVIDGQENPLANITSYKLDEVQKYVTTTGHVYNASPFLISKVFWNTLNDKEKEIMKKAALEARDYERKLAVEDEKKAAEYMKNKGIKISEMKPGEQEKLRAALAPVYEKYKSTFGEALVKEVLDATK